MIRLIVLIALFVVVFAVVIKTGHQLISDVLKDNYDDNSDC